MSVTLELLEQAVDRTRLCGDDVILMTDSDLHVITVGALRDAANALSRLEGEVRDMEIELKNLEREVREYEAMNEWPEDYSE